MKKLLAVLALLMLAGCMDVEYSIEVKNNGSGTLYYKSAMVEADEDDWLGGMWDDGDLETVTHGTLTEITYNKDDETYNGVEVTFNFQSLDELNDALEESWGDDDAEPVIFKQEGNKVIINSAGDPDSYDEVAMFASAIDFAFKIQPEGKILSHNATTFDEATNTLTWNLRDFTTQGINLEYSTTESASSGLNFIYIIIIIGVIVVISFIFKSKKTNTEVNNNPPVTE